jgi:hypothetical protein
MSQPAATAEKQPEAPNTEIKVEPENTETYYSGVPLGGTRGTDFFTKVFLLITIQYFCSTMSIWFATGDALNEEFKAVFQNTVFGTVSILLLFIIWITCYSLQWLPKEYNTKSATWWWAVYGVYIIVFAYSAGFVAANALLDINFLFNLYLLVSFGGVLGYNILCYYKRWYIRPGYMIVAVLVFNYLSWTIMHYAGLTDASFLSNLFTAGFAGAFVILGICYTAVVLEDGYAYKDANEFIFASIVFLVETLIVVFTLVRSLYVEPRKPFLKEKNTCNTSCDAKKEEAPATQA